MAGRYRQDTWMDEFNSSSKYIESFEFTVPYDHRLLRAQIRPSADKQYYTVTLNYTFFGHLVKDGEGWKDLTGNRNDTISEIGRLIEEKINKK
jgi:hypothetical protein